MIKIHRKQNEYDKYLKEHIAFVQKGLTWICDHVPKIVENVDVESLKQQIAKHDKSKYSAKEYTAYNNYFYGKRTPEVEKAFNYAWLHHIHNNLHHWQHWLLQEDDGDMIPLEMPVNHVIEMLCDHWAFSWKSGNLKEIQSWYDTNKDNIVLNENTRTLYEQYLRILIAAVDEQDK